MTRSARACAASTNTSSLRVVERLQRRVEPNALHRGFIGCRRVEDRHTWIWRRPLPKSVHAAAVAIRPGSCHPDEISTAEIGNTCRLRWQHAGAADAMLNEAGGGQCNVSNNLGLHAQARTARQQNVFGVAFLQFRSDFRRLAIGGGSDDQSMQSPFGSSAAA